MPRAVATFTLQEMPTATCHRPASASRPTDVLTDDLTASFAAGDATVLPQLYTRYGGPMLTAALHLLRGDRALAEEAVGAAMLKAWQAADTFDPARPLAPWLFTIVRHCAIDIARRERRHHIESLDASESDPPAIAPDGFERTWEALTVRDALRTLPDEEHSVMRLAYYEDFTHSEIARELEIPIGTVKSRSARAHARLRSQLGRRFALAG
jgi:RNA polymerase sigma-70 factor, ECF subfamily